MFNINYSSSFLLLQFVGPLGDALSMVDTLESVFNVLNEEDSLPPNTHSKSNKSHPSASSISLLDLCKSSSSLSQNSSSNGNHPSKKVEEALSQLQYPNNINYERQSPSSPSPLLSMSMGSWSNFSVQLRKVTHQMINTRIGMCFIIAISGYRCIAMLELKPVIFLSISL